MIDPFLEVIGVAVLGVALCVLTYVFFSLARAVVEQVIPND